MRTVTVFTHDACLAHDPGAIHVERPARLVAARRGAAASGAPLAWAEAPEAREEDLWRVHTAEHLETVRGACAEGRWLDPDTWAGPGSWEAALRAAGGAVAAAERAAAGEPAVALVRPPGHHATPPRAMGFCLFSNVAVAAAVLADRGLRVAVVDPDVHHGNGTQDAFARDGRVLFASLHQSPLYPGTGFPHERGEGPGAGRILNVPLPAGTGHDGWLECVDAAVVPALRRFAPDVVLASAGFDAHVRDPLGGLRLVGATYHAFFRRICEVQPRVAAVLEGGYDEQGLARGVAATCAALAGAPCPDDEAPPAGARPWPEVAPRLADHPALR